MRLHDRDLGLFRSRGHYCTKRVLEGGVVFSNSTGTLGVVLQALNISDWSSTCSLSSFFFLFDSSLMWGSTNNKKQRGELAMDGEQKKVFNPLGFTAGETQKTGGRNL